MQPPQPPTADMLLQAQPPEFLSTPQLIQEAIKPEAQPFDTELEPGEKIVIGAMGAAALGGTIAYREGKERFSHYAQTAAEKGKDILESAGRLTVRAIGAAALVGGEVGKEAISRLHQYATGLRALLHREPKSKPEQTVNQSSTEPATPEEPSFGRLLMSDRHSIVAAMQKAALYRASGNEQATEKYIQAIADLVDKNKRAKWRKDEIVDYYRSKIESVEPITNEEVMAARKAKSEGDLATYQKIMFELERKLEHNKALGTFTKEDEQIYQNFIDTLADSVPAGRDNLREVKNGIARQTLASAKAEEAARMRHEQKLREQELRRQRKSAKGDDDSSGSRTRPTPKSPGKNPKPGRPTYSARAST